MPSHNDLCALHARNCINEISVICYKQSSNHHYDDNDNKNRFQLHSSDRRLSSNDIPQSYDSSIISNYLSHTNLNLSLQCIPVFTSNEWWCIVNNVSSFVSNGKDCKFKHWNKHYSLHSHHMAGLWHIWIINVWHNSCHYICALQFIYLSSCHLQLREYCAVLPLDVQLYTRNYETAKLLSVEASRKSVAVLSIDIDTLQ